MRMWELYDKYLWEKCSKMTYYNRVRQWMDYIEALKPIDKTNSKWVTRSKKYQDEMDWYYQYEWPKVNRQRFYQRMYRWYPKEEAIRVDFTPKKKKLPTLNKNLYIRSTVTKKKPKEDIDIEIKYQRDEADVIKREYERMIDDLEYQWKATDDPIEAKEINDKIEKLKIELNEFCKINY